MKPPAHPIGPTPPDFLMAEFAGTLPPELFAPLELLFALRSCLQRVNAGLLQQLGPDALSPGRMQLMMVLMASRTPMQQTRLVELLGVSRASLSELLETLARDGLVETQPDPQHGRRLLVKLSRKGRVSARRKLQDNATRLRAYFASLSPAEQRGLTSLLHRLCKG